MARSTTTRKQKTFPALDAPAPKPAVIRRDASSDEDGSDDDSDAPEAVTLSGGRAVADAREEAMKEHEQKMKDQRKAKNKAREEFIQSTKSKTSLGASAEQDVDEEDESEEDEGGSQDEGQEGAGDPVLQARMARAMQDAEDEEQDEDEDEEQDEDEDEEEESSDVESEEPIIQAPRQSTRLPDAIFAAAAAADQSTERKRAKKASKKEVQVKRRRIREAPMEQVVNGRTLRVTTPIDDPPSLSSSRPRKTNKNTKGGSAFRRKWKKLDALRSQIRSRSGPARNFVTSVQ